MLKRNTLESVHVPPSLSIWDLFEFEQSLRDTRVPGTTQIWATERISQNSAYSKYSMHTSHLRGLLQSRPDSAAWVELRSTFITALRPMWPQSLGLAKAPLRTSWHGLLSFQGPTALLRHIFPLRDPCQPLVPVPERALLYKESLNQV